MGLNYSYVLVIEPSVQEQLLASVRRSGTIEHLPEAFGTCVMLHFSLDDALLAYLVDVKSRDESSHGPCSVDENQYRNYFPTNTTGRVGCIYLESQLDSASELLYVSFTAATSDMSRLFQQSGSIQNWFVELGSGLRATAVFLHQEAEGYRFVLLRGQAAHVELPEDLDNVPLLAFSESLALSVGRGYERRFLI